MLFIVLEGGEGSGKSTTIELLAEKFKQDGFTVITTREPGGTKLGEEVREILMNYELSDKLRTKLFAFSFEEKCEELIYPEAPNLKTIILCDRWYYSTCAYQGADITSFKTVAAPDVAVYLHVSPEIGLSRKNNEEYNFAEREGLEYLQEVSSNYDDLCSDGEFDYIYYTAYLSLDDVVASLYSSVKEDNIKLWSL